MEQFKIGDWVVHGGSKAISRVETEEQAKRYTSRNSNPNITTRWSFWKPQEDEWCWCVWMQSYGIQRRELIKWNNRITLDSFDIVEPFIGTLPSFLKETR